MKRPPFVALVPVKPPAVGKSRMHGVSQEQRAALAAGFALDVVAACLAAPSVARVLAVTDDAHFAAELTHAGCDVVPDGVAGDLNETLRLAAREAVRRWPDLGVVAVCADLPALRPEEVEAALAAWSGDVPGFVGDADGTGTTLYVAPPGRFSPAFGPGSRDAHLAAGAVELAGELVTLRRDVDDLVSLATAQRLGVGRRTARALADLPPLD